MQRVVAAILVTGTGLWGAGPSTGAAAPGQAADPVVTATPATDLLDGDAVELTGTGFPASGPVYAAPCPADATTFYECDLSRYVYGSADSAGTVSLTIEAVGVIRLDDRDVDCRQPGACAAGVATEDDLDQLELVPLHFVPDGPLRPPPTVSVEPDVALAEGQAVLVTGSGFGHARWVAVTQCAVGVEPPSWSSCDAEGEYEAIPEEGSFQVSVIVHSMIGTYGRGTIDCRTPGSCAVVATVGFAPDRTAVAGIGFAPDAMPPAAASLTVRPDEGLVDGQRVELSGSGFEPDSYAQAYQCAPAVSGAVPECESLGASRSVGSDGTLRPLAANVHARIATPGGTVDCRTSEDPCLLVAGSSPHSPRAGRAPIGFDPDGPLLPDPTIVVTPSTDLVEPATVSVTGQGFTPEAHMSVSVCHGEDEWLCDYDSARGGLADADGSFDVELIAYGEFSTEGQTIDCRQPPGCVVTARDHSRELAVSTPISFGPPPPSRGRYYDHVFDEVEVTRDVVYRETVDSRGNPVQLKVDIYQPVGDTAALRPAVVWMHGGYYVFGDKTNMAEYATDMARRGYVAVSLQYRLRPDMPCCPLTDIDQFFGAMYDAYDDGVAGIDWLRQHAGDYRIDPDAISAGGYSAGAGIAFNLAHLPRQRGPATSNIAAAVSIAGSTAGFPDPGEPPVIAFHGTADTVVPFDWSEAPCNAANAAGLRCDLVPYEGEGHGIFSSKRRDILRRSADFLAEVMLTPAGHFAATAEAAGPYTVDEGSRVILDGVASSGTGLDYMWSPADRVDDPAAPRPMLTGLDDGTEAVTLTVTNAHGIAASDVTEVATHNIDPSIADLTLSSGAAGRAAMLAARVTDPGLADTHTAEIDWGDGTTTLAAVEQDAGGAVLTASHDYAEPGDYEVTIVAQDDDGGAVAASRQVLVGCTITGTEDNDSLRGTARDDVICGLGGDDRISGLAGNDRIIGGDGDDWMAGHGGEDILIGGPGWDIAIAGRGNDLCSAELRTSCRTLR